MSYLEKGLRNLGSSFAFGFLAVVAGYVTRMFLAKFLEINDFGLVYASITTVAFLTIFTNLGFGSAQAKYIPHYYSRDESGKVAGLVHFSFFTRLVFSLAVACVMAVFSGWFSVKYFKGAGGSVVYLTAASIVLVTIFNTLSRFFQGFQRIFMMSFMEFLQKALFFALTLALLFDSGLRQGRYVLVFYSASVLLAIFFTAPVFLRIKRSLGRAVISRELVRTVVVFCATAFMAQTGFMVIENLNTVMLTYLGSLKDVAVFNVVLPSTMALIFFGKSLSSVLLPLVSEMWAKGERQGVASVVRLVNRYVLFITLPVIMAVVMFPGFFLGFFFGDAFVEGSNALRVLCFGAFFLNLSLAYQSALSAVDRIKFVTSSVAVSAFVNAALNLALIPFMGYFGAALATSFAYLVLLVQNVYNMRDFISVRPEFFQLAKLFLAGAVFVLSAFVLKGFAVGAPLVIFIVSVCGAVYTAFCFAVKIVSVSEIKFLVGKFLQRKRS